jgi:hypothetical protein
LNKAVVASIQRLAWKASFTHGSDDDTPLFSGQRGLSDGAIGQPVGQAVVQGHQPQGQLRESFSLRKTFGYHQRVTFGRGIPELMVVFNHSTQRQTLEYLCIQPEEVKSIYLNEL